MMVLACARSIQNKRVVGTKQTMNRYVSSGGKNGDIVTAGRTARKRCHEIYWYSATWYIYLSDWPLGFVWVCTGLHRAASVFRLECISCEGSDHVRHKIIWKCVVYIVWRFRVLFCTLRAQQTPSFIRQWRVKCRGWQVEGYAVLYVLHLCIFLQVIQTAADMVLCRPTYVILCSWIQFFYKYQCQVNGATAFGKGCYLKVI